MKAFLAVLTGLAAALVVFVVPASAIAGAALLLLADTFARRIAAPLDLPVGPFLVVLGVPLFLWLLRKAI